MGRERYSKVNVDCEVVVRMLTYCGENLVPVGINHEVIPDISMYETIRARKLPPVADRRSMIAAAHRRLKDRRK
jgi:hypothetical protein